MRKKYLSALLFGALLVTSAGTFTSCKDYDDDINNLQEQITANADAIKALEELVKAGKYVSGVAIEGQVITFTFSDGSTTPITIPEGEKGQTVEVKDNELYIDGEATGIKVAEAATAETGLVKAENGTWWVLGEDGEYTNTNIPVSGVTVTGSDAAGYELTIYTETGKQTVKLPTAASTISKLTVIEDLSFGFVSGTNSNGANPILWGHLDNQNDAMKNWKGPKGAVAANQLMVGVIDKADPAVEVSPASVDLGAQELALYDSKGNKAPVVVKAVANSNDLAVDGGSRAASANGKWNLELALDETVNKDNIKSAFDSNGKSILYALSVNGVVMTGYDIVVNVDANKTGAKIAVPETADADELAISYTKQGENTATTLGINDTDAPKCADLVGLKIGSTTFTIEGSESAKMYDAYIELTDADKSGRYEVTASGMTITATEKAANQELPVKIHILDVAGNETIIESDIKFGTSSVEGETIENQSFVVMPNEDYFIVDLGNTFTSLTDEDADKVNGNITWSVAKDGKTLAQGDITTKVSYFETEEKAIKNEGALTMSSASTIKKAKFAKVSKLSDIDRNNDTETGSNKVTITLKDEKGNEVKKVSTELTFTAPSFDDLVTANTEYALWSDGAFTTRMTYNANATASTLVPMNGAFISKVTDATKPGYVDVNDEITYTHKYVNASGAEVTVSDLTSIVNQGKKLASQLSTEATITLYGKIKATKKFTTNLLSIFEGASLVYYKDGATTDVAELTADNLIKAYVAATQDTKANGLAITFNKDLKAVNSELVTEGVGGIKIATTGSGNSQVKVDFSLENGSVGTKPNAFGTDGITIDGVSVGQGGTLVMTFTDQNNVNTSVKIKYRK